MYDIIIVKSILWKGGVRMTAIKRKLRRAKRKFIRFLMWIMRECKNWQTIVLLLAVAAVMQLPTWGGYLLFWLFGWKWAFAVATVAVIFWAGPFSPFWVICVSITLAIKRTFYKATHIHLHSKSDELPENTVQDRTEAKKQNSDE